MKREEAIKLVKRIKGAMVYTEEEKEALETLIPELRESESEDKKFQKYILKACKECVEANDNGLELSMSTTKKLLSYLEKQKAKERFDRMAPIYNDKESFESALEKAWKYYNESASRTVDSFEDDYIECVFSKGFREGFLYKEKQKEEEGYEAIPVESTLEYKLGFKAGKESEKQKEQKPLITGNDFGWIDELKHDLKHPEELDEKVQEVLKKRQKPVEYLDKDKVYAIMTKLTNLSYSQLIPINSDEFKKLHEITSDVRDLLDYPIEQKPAEYADDVIEEAEEYTSKVDCGDYSVEVTEAYIAGVLSERNRGTEWSENDEAQLDDIEKAISNYYDLNHAPQYHYWLEEKLKSLRPSWKPSEEELVALKHAGGILRDCGHGELAKEVFMIEGKLANLSVINKSIWKPSEEQMEHLKRCFSHGKPHLPTPNQHVLESLHNDLKKLM